MDKPVAYRHVHDYNHVNLVTLFPIINKNIFFVNNAWLIYKKIRRSFFLKSVKNVLIIQLTSRLLTITLSYVKKNKNSFCILSYPILYKIIHDYLKELISIPKVSDYKNRANERIVAISKYIKYRLIIYVIWIQDALVAQWFKIL